MKTPSLLRLGWVLALALVVAWGVSAFPAPAETEDIALSKRQEVQAAGGQGGGQSGTTLSETMPIIESYRTKTFTWTIDKTANPTVLDLVQGQSGTVDYTVTLTKDDGTFRTWIKGEVCIKNGGSVATEGLESTLKVTRPSDPTVIVSPKLDVSAKPVLAAGESHCYPYSIDIPEPASGTYKVTADTTITNHSGHLGTPFGPNESKTTTIPEATLVHNTVTVSDTLQGSLGQVSDDETKKYTRTFTCANEGDNPNTASITYEDGSPGPSDLATVTVKCTGGGGGGGGCTRTIGYWKNHIEVIKGPPELLPISLGSRQVTDPAEAVQIEGTTGSNGIDKLYAQLLAAKLNIKTGADGSAVASTIQAADTFLTGKTSADWASLTNAQKSQVNGWATTLDNYNNGVTGPGHCP